VTTILRALRKASAAPEDEAWSPHDEFLFDGIDAQQAAGSLLVTMTAVAVSGVIVGALAGQATRQVSVLARQWSGHTVASAPKRSRTIPPTVVAVLPRERHADFPGPPPLPARVGPQRSTSDEPAKVEPPPPLAPAAREPVSAPPVAPPGLRPRTQLPVAAPPAQIAVPAPPAPADAREQIGQETDKVAPATPPVELAAALPPRAELPVAELPVAELPVAELPVAELPGAEPPVAVAPTDTEEEAHALAERSVTLDGGVFVRVSRDQHATIAGTASSLKTLVEQICRLGGIDLRSYSAPDRPYAGNGRDVPIQDLLRSMLRSESYLVGIKVEQASRRTRLSWLRVIGAAAPGMAGAQAQTAQTVAAAKPDEAPPRAPMRRFALSPTLLYEAFGTMDASRREEGQREAISRLSEPAQRVAFIESDANELANVIANYEHSAEGMRNMKAMTQLPDVAAKIEEVLAALQSGHAKN
jgi:hypothetical protein